MVRIVIVGAVGSLTLLAQVACTNSGLGREDTDDTDGADTDVITGSGTGATAGTGTGAATATGTGAGPGTGATATGSGTGTGAGIGTGTGTGTGTGGGPVDLSVRLSVDGAWEAFVDGNPVGSHADWPFTAVYRSSVVIPDPGPHVVAIHAQDGGDFSDIVGLIAVVEAGDRAIGLTGDTTFKVTPFPPQPDWVEPTFDSSGWGTPIACDGVDVAEEWEGEPTELTTAGAQWVWYRPCTQLGEAWFRLEFTTPIP